MVHDINSYRPCIIQKKCSFFGAHGTQNDRLEPRGSTQKSGLKNMHRVPRYQAKRPKNQVAKPNPNNFGCLANILEPGTPLLVKDQYISVFFF